MAPFSQISIRGGFLLCAEDEMHEILSTGIADWQVSELDAYKFRRSTVLGGSGTQAETTVIAENLPSDYRTGRGIKFISASCHFKNAGAVTNGNIGSWWKLTPSTLPEMMKLRVLIDLKNYYCAYPSMLVNKGKGSSMKIQWSESLFEKLEDFTKGNRDEVYGKIFHGEGDTFLPNGKKTFLDTLWWRAGRYIEILIETANEELKIENFSLHETHYPFKKESKFLASDKSLTSFFG